MNQRVTEPLANRTVAVRFPNGDIEYWLTDQSFSIGQSIRCRNQDWIIDDPRDASEGKNHHETVTLRPADGAAPQMVGQRLE